ncbi:Transcription factor MYB44 [Acorus gramineus]|uniref:Transcription factor MYB44 n=1 Tax=Acorus gramineus TaxID=55184 RepID=A0AAV9B3K1_ACOGR|nr:Transcription factor MYB44 [Acorus gramineus]
MDPPTPPPSPPRWELPPPPPPPSTPPNQEQRRVTVARGPWTPEEDKELCRLVEAHGPKDWASIREHFTGRSSKSCRLRWVNQKSPEIMHGSFTPDEDLIIVEEQAKYGNKWAKIARRLPGRTDNMVKNRWNCTLRSRVGNSAASGDDDDLNSDGDATAEIDSEGQFDNSILIDSVEVKIWPRLSQQNENESQTVIKSQFGSYGLEGTNSILVDLFERKFLPGLSRNERRTGRFQTQFLCVLQENENECEMDPKTTFDFFGARLESEPNIEVMEQPAAEILEEIDLELRLSSGYNNGGGN